VIDNDQWFRIAAATLSLVAHVFTVKFAFRAARRSNTQAPVRRIHLAGWAWSLSIIGGSVVLYIVGLYHYVFYHPLLVYPLLAQLFGGFVILCLSPVWASRLAGREGVKQLTLKTRSRQRPDTGA
jgi:hypothetical protein